MAVEVRKTETTYHETGDGKADRIEVTYEIGFSTPSGGWVRFMGVPEAVVQAAEDNAKAASSPQASPTDLSQPAPVPEPVPTPAPAPGGTDLSQSAPPAEPEPDPAAPPAEPATPPEGETA